MKILIMGASSAGSTTLGKALSAHTGYPYFDTDDYFWIKSAVPYTVRRDREDRIQMLTNDVTANPCHIVGGSLVSWGDQWLHHFDLVVFLYLPPEVRMQRLKDREHERYGDLIFTDPERIRLYNEFVAWAESYDTVAHTGRSIKVHEEWLSRVTCPVLRINGDTTVQERVDRVLEKISDMGNLYA